jgi:hypothetical protein
MGQVLGHELQKATRWNGDSGVAGSRNIAIC